MLAEDVLGTPTSRLRGTVNVTRTWSQQRSAPTKKVVTKVAVRTISNREGHVEFEATEELTVRELKQRIAHRLHISPRKLMTLRWWGAVMDDEKTLDECHVADGGLLELSLKNHAQGELDALKDVRQVRVRVASGSMVVVDEVTTDTTIGAIKRTIIEGKLFGALIDAKAPPPIELLYTPCLLAAGSFGNALDDESTLGQHGVLHDDLLYLRLPAPEPPPPPPKKKK